MAFTSVLKFGIASQLDTFESQVFIFDEVGTFTWKPPKDTTHIEYVIVGGGGGAGTNGGGAGGAGGYRSSVVGERSGGDTDPEPRLAVDPNTQYTITVGRGGLFGAGSPYRGPLDSSTRFYGENGANSSFSDGTISIVSTGGGGGGTGGNSSRSGLPGGSGGGGAAFGTHSSNTPHVGGSGQAGQGNNGGGASSNATRFVRAGGGGAKTPAPNVTHFGAFNFSYGEGGEGLTTNITGEPLLLAEGGRWTIVGGSASNLNAITPPAGTGSGGYDGASGIVIIKTYKL